MLGENYFEINGKGYTPSSFDYSLTATENINKSEAGTDIVTTIRLNQHTFNATWNGITSDLLEELEGYAIQNVVTVVYRGKTYRCRARNWAPKLATKSYLYKKSDGLWDITLSFTEI